MYMNYTKIENLTVGQYQELYKIHKSTDEDIDKAIASVAILTDKTRWEVEELPLMDFTGMSKEISILFSNPEVKSKVVKSVRINGKKYVVILNPRKLSAGQYIDLQTFLKGNLIENLHRLMASLLIQVKYSPLNIRGKYDGENHEKIAEGIQSLKFSEIHSTCVFFSKLWTASIKAMETYLKKEWKKKTKNQMNPPLMDLQALMAGFTVPSK